MIDPRKEAQAYIERKLNDAVWVPVRLLRDLLAMLPPVRKPTQRRTAKEKK